MNTKLLDVPTFAHEINVSKACVRRWIVERKIASINVGRLVRVPQSEVHRTVESGLGPARRQQ
jgi:excisionase family DNA binding protein